MSYEDSRQNTSIRYDMLSRKLGTLVGADHPRLSNPSLRFTVGDINAAELTYGQIVSRIPNGHSPELPSGFVKAENASAELVLQEYHLATVVRSLRDGYAGKGSPTELAGHDVIELQNDEGGGIGAGLDEYARWLHPTVEGYSWYRGYKAIISEDEAAIIFAPWVQPWSEGGSPFPIMYTKGTIPEQDLIDIAFAYSAS